MIMVTGKVKYAAGEPYDAGYGLKINVVVIPDPGQGDIPGVKDGVIKVYKKVDSSDAQYMRTLNVGDPVKLAYQTNQNGRGWYNFITDNPPPNKEEAQEEPQQSQSRTGQTYGRQFWTPLTGEQIVTFSAVATDAVRLLIHTLQVTQDQLDEAGIVLPEEIVWKMAVTAYINTHKEWHRGLEMVFDDDEEDEYTQ